MTEAAELRSAIIGLAALAARLPAAAAWAATAALAAWNALLIANLQYVVDPNVDPGYAGLLRGQAAAVRFLPHLAVKGDVVRDLLLWRLIGGRLSPASGLAWLGLEAACVAVLVALVSVRLDRQGEPPGPWPRLDVAVAPAPAGETRRG